MSAMNTEGLLEEYLTTTDVPADENLYMVNGDSYASRAARTSNTADETRPQPFFVSENSMPQRPKSAFFTPNKSTSARAVFDAFAECKISPTDIQCLQRKLNGEVVVTFKSIAAKEQFLRLNSLNIDSEPFALQDIDKPLTYLTIYDAPFELSDLAIIKRLSSFCEVLHYRRGKHSYAPNIYNGLRHYRVRIIKPIPSFIRFGKHQVFIKYSGQNPTCRKCNLPGHFSNSCTNKICFNCEGVGHEARHCPRPLLCCICKEDGHLGVNCEYSWVFPVVQGCHTDEAEEVNIEDDLNENLSVASVPSPPKLSTDENSTPSNENSTQNLSLSTENPTHENSTNPPVSTENSMHENDPIDENLPLASALPRPNQPIQSDQAADSFLLPPPDDFNATQLSQPEQPSRSELQEQPSEPEQQSSQPESPLVTSQGLIASIKSAIKPSSRRTPAKLSDDSSLACSRKPTAPTLVSGKSRSSIPIPTTTHTPLLDNPEEMETTHELKRKSSELSTPTSERKKGRNRPRKPK